ncbi:MAG: hypothetical protein ACLP7Q_10485 [Isosphaeraceae bacterium]
MSVALQWLAVVLAGLAGAAAPPAEGPQINYEFRIVEVHGLQWREAASHGLKPVTSRGGVNVWTAPRDFFKSLPQETLIETAKPTLRSVAQAAAHMTMRKNRPFVTQVAWRGEGEGPRETTEIVREGVAATVSGRPIDQGILAQLVIEDTDIRAVHTLCLSDPVLPQGPDRGRDGDAKKAAWHPRSDQNCCLDDDAIAVECHGAGASACTAQQKKSAPPCSPQVTAWAATSRTAQIQVPEIGRAEIAGEWLIPRDEILVIGFGPHTIADKEGKAIVRERLALVSAEVVAAAFTSQGDQDPAPAFPGLLPRIARVPGWPALSPAPTIPGLPTPPLPSRSLPQGYNSDGSPTDLPPLPDDEKAEPSASDSAEPRPSPQTKKIPSGPSTEPSPSATPAAPADSRASKAGFVLPRGLLKQPALPPALLPGLQFMMPLKPLAMKLPFSQKLELELIGRVMPDADTLPQMSPLIKCEYAADGH